MIAPSSFADRIPVDQIAGLRPEAWICVGPGFAREDIKTVILSRGVGFVGEAVTTLQDIARRITGAQELLGPQGRQELLRVLLAESRISSQMPELKRLKRQGGFYRKLDQAIQAGRMAFAHAEEEQVYRERLRQRLGQENARAAHEEVRRLGVAYEAWLKAGSHWDVPLVFREAVARLNGQGWPESIRLPRSIHLFSHQTPESLEREFCEALGRFVEFRRIGPLTDTSPASPTRARWNWQRWHTLDDAVERLADELAVAVSDGTLGENAVLIPDLPAVRRCLNRALNDRGLKQSDPRDPTRVRWDEAIKWATLPIEVVARDYERPVVVSWLRSYFLSEKTAESYLDEFVGWVNEINSRGARRGLRPYAGGSLSGIHSRLIELRDAIGGRRTCGELAEAHLRILRSFAGLEEDRAWVVDFFETIWRDFSEDYRRLGLREKRAPLLYWHERLQSRIAEASSPVEPLRPGSGVLVYRAHQVPLLSPRRVWLLGLPPEWLSGEGDGDYWFSEKEREILGAEFAVRSGIQAREERIAALRAWVADAEEIHILDARYDFGGRERETLAPLLQGLAVDLGATADGGARREPLEGLVAAIERAGDPGSHHRWSASYGALREPPPLRIELGPARTEISATALDHYSRCGFQALAYHRWRLRDLRDPGAELWPEVKGNILHQAVRLLLQSRDAAGNFAITPADALDRAWRGKPVKGLFKSPRIESYVRSRLLGVLEVFCEKEREYSARSGARPIQLDDATFRVEYPGFTVVGTPDRIDATDDGLFILDYKSTSSVPNGSEMLERGYRLQLPFYALAAARQIRRPVLGVQFVELTRKGGRGSGIFFKRFNGKDVGRLTNVRSNSKSLLAIEPEEAWARLEEQIIEQGKLLVSGVFEARPRAARPEKECSTCALGDFCGLRRVADSAGEEEA